ncbi:L-threonylcarbamoyladenylate synthase [Coxiella endosymbiont of Amblyomma americanum]|uniref:L-threonylcarbamoyladenylate synthase n=1 Tax=Coxiella endosymbiont of Amblyomma americanum TaxID=325775 RepID=UPI00057C8A2A|nr:L-threonylcarbamoyladenylate synthase [Coxiella endosymbiont of Amblyomma americanum]AJC50358.1 tRNA threonylcarbamoyladenosine biosynthesis protein RimN [Coxiella endosymbiont of Amblyomma americanum]AUJ58703.1 threonylcarbamoyl-AMP synthase [Coxiella-like endosymbiont of Amblyomma americanum]
MIVQSIKKTVESLCKGKVIAYPTEAVYSFGCDPFNFYSVSQLLALKNRSVEKGFILIASEWKQISMLTSPIDSKRLDRIFNTWPGPITWLFPAKSEVPFWIRGNHATIAVRITDHPLAQLLCRHFGKPIISTSANLKGHPPIQNIKTLQLMFDNSIDTILEGPLGSSKRPTTIRDAITGKVLRIG